MNSTLAKIALIEESDKAYTKLVLANHIPWKTRCLTFSVWNKTKLFHNNQALKLGDAVRVDYKSQKNAFLKLISLEPAQVDTCSVCYSLYDMPRDGQRIDCGLCSIYDEDKRGRISEELKLIANTEKECTFSKGQCLTFVNEETDNLYFAWSFVRKPYFKRLVALKTQMMYNVNGWIEKRTEDGDFVIKLTDVPDLCKQ